MNKSMRAYKSYQEAGCLQFARDIYVTSFLDEHHFIDTNVLPSLFDVKDENNMAESRILIRGEKLKI